MTECKDSTKLFKTFRVVRRMAVNVLQAGNENEIGRIYYLSAVSTCFQDIIGLIYVSRSACCITMRTFFYTESLVQNLKYVLSRVTRPLVESVLAIVQFMPIEKPRFRCFLSSFSYLTQLFYRRTPNRMLFAHFLNTSITLQKYLQSITLIERIITADPAAW